MERTPEGRRLLDRFFFELTDGHLSADDSRQVHRILAHRAQRIGVEAFARAVLDPRTRIFPVRRTGVTVLDQAAPELRWMEDGAFRVKYSTYAYRDGPTGLDFRGEDVGEDDVIGVKLYDQGGRVAFGPALMLVQHANQTSQQVVLKMVEMAGLGLAAGLSGAAVKVTFLVWCDRAAVALGVLTSLVDEHRGWILERYGEVGERFLFYSDVVSSAVVLYGVARVVTAAPQLVRGLRDAYARFKTMERGALPDVERATEGVLRDFEGAEVISIDEARPRWGVDEPLQATGTDGTLIRLGEEGETTVASLRRGNGPKEPLRPAGPSTSRASGASSSRALRLGVSPQDAEEAEALLAKFAEAESAAPGRRQTANLVELAKLRPELSRPPRGADASSLRWQEYVAYWEERFDDLTAGAATKPPLEWSDYERLRNIYARGIAHQRATATALVSDAAKPAGQRRFIKGIKEPLVESNVGIFKSNEWGTRYADHLVVDGSTLKSSRPRGVVFSDKSRELSHIKPNDALAIARADAQEAIAKYGGRIVVRRRGHVLFGRQVDLERVYLIYEEQWITDEGIKSALEAGAAEAGVEVLYR